MQPADFLAGVLGGTNAAPSTKFEPQKMNAGVLRISDIGNFTSSAGAPKDVLTLSLESFSLPKVTTNITVLAYLNEIRKYAGNTVYEDVDIVFRDFVDRACALTLWNWFYAIHDPTTGQKAPKVYYAKTGEIETTGPTTGVSAGQSMLYDLVNIWPSHADFGNIDFNSDEPVRISVRFAIDKILPRTAGVVSPAQPGAGSGIA